MKKVNEKLYFTKEKWLKNRIMMAPMTTKQSFFDGAITSDEIAYYAQRSKGTGAVIVSAANVQPIGKGWHGALSIADDTMIAGLTQLATAIKNEGAKAFIQLFHAGRMTKRAVLWGETPVSASNIAPEREGYEAPRELSNVEIEQIIKDFGLATRRAIESGFDGVEIHGANTYLIQQFFSPHSNRRMDKWGGSVEKRYTFIGELVKEVLSVVAEIGKTDFVVGYRFSPEEFETPGIRFEDTIYLVEQLLATDLDYLHVSLNDYNRVSTAANYQEKPILAYLADIIQGKKALVGVGGIRTRKDIEQTLENADLIAVGQQLLIDPTWSEKIIEQCDSEIITTDFATAIEQVELTHPLADFLEGWK